MSANIISIAKVRARKLCPKCKRPTLTRKAIEHDGLKLYDLTERCILCSHETVYENVRIG